MLKDLPVTALLAAGVCTAVYMYFSNEYDLTKAPDALALFVVLAIVFTLVRWGFRLYRSQSHVD